MRALQSIRWLLLALVLAGLMPQLRAQTADKKDVKTVRLLTVGNSFSGNATRYLADIVKGSGNKLIYHTCSMGGATMAQHCEKFEAFEKDPKDPKGIYGKMSLRQALVAEPWDFITFQQASFKSHDINTYRPHAQTLYEYLHKHAPKSEIVLHQTWAYRVDDPRFARPPSSPSEPATQKAMYEGLTKSYETIAAELGIRIIPVGDAFYRADTDAKWGYKPDVMFDRKNALYPKLPDQTHSLHVGYSWGAPKDDKRSLGIDGHHANLAGEYLGACVFYEFLYGDSVVGNPFVPKGLHADYARFLQETAHQAVADRRKGEKK